MKKMKLFKFLTFNLIRKRIAATVFIAIGIYFLFPASVIANLFPFLGTVFGMMYIDIYTAQKYLYNQWVKCNYELQEFENSNLNYLIKWGDILELKYFEKWIKKEYFFLDVEVVTLDTKNESGFILISKDEKEQKQILTKIIQYYDKCQSYTETSKIFQTLEDLPLLIEQIETLELKQKYLQILKDQQWQKD
jgi:hypothetical protein